MKRTFLVLLALPLIAIACVRQGDSPGQSKAAPPLEKKYLLAAEPPGAEGVVKVLETAKDAEAVVVVGRIGGHKEPFIAGQAAFLIVDCAFKPCNELPDDPCKTPWDYCCEPDLGKKRVQVKFVDESGQPLQRDARAGLGLEPLQTVVVRGTVHRKDGALAILASGVFIKSK